MLALIVLAAAAIRIRLLPVPLERDEGEYAYAGQLILQGIPPYLHVYNMKFPGIYAAYALILALFGQSHVAVHLGLLLVNSATILLMFLLGRRLLGTDAAVVVAAAYALLSLGAAVLGMFAHATHFVVLPALGGLLLLLTSTERKRPVLLLWSGLCFGLAILMKQHGLVYAFFAFLYLVLEQRRAQCFDRPQVVAGSALFVLGVVVPFGVTCLILANVGVFHRFWFWTFTYVREYAAQVPLAEGLQMFTCRIASLLKAAPLIWMLALVGVGLLLADRQARPRAAFILGLWVCSFVAVCPGLYFREHYFVMILPASALLAGAGFGQLQRRTSGTKLAAVPVILVVLAVGQALFQQRNMLFVLSPTMVSRTLYGGNPFPASLEIARYIRDHTSEQDTIAVLGSEPQIYFYSRRRSASGYIYVYPLTEPHPYARRMQMEMIREIESSEPEILVCVSVSASWLLFENSETKILSWTNDYVERYYDLVGKVEILTTKYTHYAWGEDAAAWTPRTQAFIQLYKRSPAGGM